MSTENTQWYKLQYPECFVNDEQRMIQQTISDFVDKEIMPVRHLIDDDHTHEEVVEPILKKLQIDLGFQQTMIPKDYGGNEMLSLVAAALKQEQISRGDYGISLASAVTDWALTPATLAYLMPMPPEAKAWGKAVLDEFAPMFVGKELRHGCFNMSEAESACDIENHLNEGRLVHTKAELKGDEWVINGTKHWASNSGIASLHCVACNIDPKSGKKGFVLIYVPEPYTGVSHGKFEVKCGVNADRNTSTYFDNVRVPKEWGLQGPVAWEIFVNTLVSAFPLNAANCVGILQGAFNELLEYTGQRVVGGKPIREHLSTAMFLGEMASFISIARAAFLETAYQYENMETYGSWISDSMVAKARSVLAYTARTVPELILRGMEFMGSQGYVREGFYEKYYRDSAIAKIVLGGVQLGFFSVCRQFFPLDFSSFGPDKL